MNKTIMNLMVSTLLFTSTNTYAGGIPTVDFATVSQVKMVYDETRNHIEVAKNQLTQLSRMEEIATGSRGMGAILNSMDLGIKIPSEFVSLLKDLEKTDSYKNARKDYPTFSDNDQFNTVLDQRARNIALIEQFVQQASKRSQNVANLMKQIDLASDPAAKSDLANRLVNEQNAINSDNQMISAMNIKMAQEQKRLEYVAKQNAMCKEFPRSCK